MIRIPAGAALAAGVFGADSSAMALVAALLGGTLAATSHAAKTTTRAAINTSPEPFTNIGAVAGRRRPGVRLACGWRSRIRWSLFAVLALVLVLSVWLIRVCWRFLKQLFKPAWRAFSRQA